MKYVVTMMVVLLSAAMTLQVSAQQDRYVWADSELNVRQGPGTDQVVIEKIAFGDSVQVLAETDRSYNISGIQKVDSTQRYFTRYERKAPFILYGKWVEVLTSTGNIGYVVDQYLLPLRPSSSEGIRLEMISVDTVTKVYDDYEQRFIVSQYAGGVSTSDLINEKGYEESFTFPNMSIQDAFVILASNWRDFDNAVVTKNWKGELYFNDGELCDISIIQHDGYVVAFVSCYC